MLQIFYMDGYPIRLAENHTASVDLIDEYGAPDVIITDFAVLDISIDDFVEHVRRSSPNFYILLLSTHDDASFKSNACGIHFLRAPFDPAVLREKMALFLNARIGDELPAD